MSANITQLATVAPQTQNSGGASQAFIDEYNLAQEQAPAERAKWASQSSLPWFRIALAATITAGYFGKNKDLGKAFKLAMIAAPTIATPVQIPNFDSTIELCAFEGGTTRLVLLPIFLACYAIGEKFAESPAKHE